MKCSDTRVILAKRQAGLSLIEVMVAMAIGVILMLGVTQIFSASRAAFSSNEGLARIQENSRFAMEFLRQDMRMAGNLGCLNELGYDGNIYNHLLPAAGPPTAAHWPYRIDMPVEVYEYQNTGPGVTIALSEARTTPAAGSWSPALPAALAGNALDNSDVIVVRYLSADFARLTNIVAAGGSEMFAVNPADAWYMQPVGGIYGITDCKKVTLVQVNAGGATNLGSGINLRAWDARESDYSPFSVVHRYRFVAYFVGRGAGGEPALMRRELAPNGALGPAEEMVPGVESIQVMLGVNLSLRNRLVGDRPDAYMTAAQVQNGTGAWAPSTPAQRWASVVNFRVGMLMRNARPGAADTPVNLPRIADTVVSPPQDGRMRQTYEVQIAIRNRVRD
ncbi:PilW family protein [Xanthomonadaceae bacterium XH05]|nr:PilW family protein [Xanthomonadaceae bacterium XH05]